MFAAALLPWWPKFAPPSSLVRRVMDPPSVVIKINFADGANEFAFRLLSEKGPDQLIKDKEGRRLHRTGDGLRRREQLPPFYTSQAH